MQLRAYCSKSLPAIAALVVLTAAGCSGPSTSRRPARGTQAQSAIAGSTLEGLARRCRPSLNKTRKFLAAAIAYSNEGLTTSAIRCAHEAHKGTSNSQLRAQVDFILGRAHLSQLKLSLAQRYLEKSRTGLKGEEAQESLAYLVVCLRMQKNTSEAEAIARKLTAPDSPRVKAILTAPRPRAMEEKPRAEPIISRLGKLPSRPSATYAKPLPTLQVIPRTYWKAKSLVKSRAVKMSKVFRMTLHHSGEPGGVYASSRWANGREILRIQRYHQGNKGWADIGYHYIVDREGRVWQGRPVSYQGAHAKGDANKGNVGIVLLGNYSPRKQSLTRRQRDSLKLLVLKLGRIFSISQDHLYTHSQILPGHTTCPGPGINAYAKVLRTELKRDRSSIQLTSNQAPQRGK